MNDLLRGFVRALGSDLLFSSDLFCGGLLLRHGRSLVQLIGLGLAQLAGIDERGDADTRQLLDVARHAGSQRLTAESIFAAVSMIVVWAIALLAFGDSAGDGRYQQ